MALKGTLKDFALPDIFQLIGMQRKTGLLTLESERETVTVVFETGMVVLADSSVRRLDDLLGSVLVRQGKLKKQTLDEVLAKQKVSMQRLGYILTNQGYIDADALKEALFEQVQQIVFRVFRWKSGQYDFDPTATVDYDRQHVSPVSTDHILMEGIRRVDEWPIIEKRIPSLQMVFRPLVSQSQIQVGGEGAAEGGGLETAFDGLESDREERPEGAPPSDKVVLSEAEAAVYNLLDGKRSISTIMDSTGLSDFDVSRTLFDLIERNLVAPVGHQKERVVDRQAPPVQATSQVLGVVILCVVIAASGIGLLFSYAAPFHVPGRPNVLSAELNTYHRTASLARMERVDNAVRAYFLAFGVYPGSLDDLVTTNPALLSPEDLNDSLGVRFGYERGTERVVLFTSSDSGEADLVLMHIIPVDPSQP
jgi:hypothetical protein